MALLKSPYELSLWGDYYDENSGEFQETRKGIIGSNTMIQEWRAQNVQLIKNVNGSKTLTFTMYNKYIDNLSGEEVFNPYTSLTDGIKNEDKLKLKYNGQWYDFIVKNITEDSSTQSYSFSATDLFINELSKNGFEVTLDTKLLNNYGTVTSLGEKVLENTDWDIDEEHSDICVQTKNEFLVLVEFDKDKLGQNICPLLDPQKTTNHWTGTSSGEADYLSNLRDEKIQSQHGTVSSITDNNSLYALAFYSSCTTKPRVFQFIYIPGLDSDGKISKTFTYTYDGDKTGNYASWSKIFVDDDGNIINKDCQYFIEGPTYREDIIGGLYYLPEGINFIKLLPYRKANRYVISTENKYLPTLEKYVEVCEKEDDDDEWYHYQETEFIPPNLIKNCVGNNTFKGTSGWTGAFYAEDTGELYTNSDNQELGRVFVEATVYPDPVETFKSFGEGKSTSEVIAAMDENTIYAPRLKVTHTSPIDYDDTNTAHFGNLTPVLIEQGFYSQRSSLSDIFCRKGNAETGGERNKLVIAWSLKEINSQGNEAFVDTRLGLQKYFTKITIEDARYDIASGRYANFNTTNENGFTSICATLNLDSWNESNVKFLDEKAYCYAIVELNHNYNGAQYEAASIKTLIHLAPPTDGYKYQEIGSSNTITSSTFYALSKKAKKQYKKVATTPFYLEDFQIFEYYAKEDKTPLFPEEVELDGVNLEKHWYFNQDMPLKQLKSGDKTGLPESTTIVATSEKDERTYPPKLDYSSQKKRIIDAKESNCFNIIQTLAEQFECWADFSISRDANGRIQSNGKKIKFKKYVGKDNYAGIQYGVNLKQVQRTNVSDALVTKMIVKMNSNEHAEDGFCSIARAKSNPTKESFLLDFSYYFKQGLMGEGFSEALFLQDMYLSIDSNGKLSNKTLSGKTAVGPDIDELTTEDEVVETTTEETEWNYYGFYDRLNKINTTILNNNQTILNKQKSLLEAESTYNLATKAAAAAIGELESARSSFTELVGPNPFEKIVAESTGSGGTGTAQASGTSIDKAATWGELFDMSPDIRHYYQAMVSARSVYLEQTALANTNKGLIDSLTSEITTLSDNNETKRSWKIELLKSFYVQYSRFIQEGTWTDEKYSDDELYYLDSLQTLYNSCWPQVTYTINALTIDMLPGYEHYRFDVGDKTWVQDVEFFGKNTDGTPYKKEVIISETTNNLDSPDKDTFKVQTFKNQFQDLFKKVTATVQSVQFSEGSYNRAAQLAAADTAQKSAFLADALTGPQMLISNAKNQSVVFGEDGITVTNTRAANEALRLTSGAIMFQRNNENGELEWKTGLTADGICADLITAGKINTGLIQIMNGNEPSFRWDSHGLTAYDFVETPSGSSISVNNSKGVTFNRFGIYGIDLTGTGNNLLTWHPRVIGDVLDKASFSLTWEGLKVVKNNAIARIGNYTENGQASIIKVNNGIKDTFLVKEDGDVEVNGDITATTGFIGDWNIADGELRYIETKREIGLSKKDGIYNHIKEFGLSQTQSLTQTYQEYTQLNWITECTDVIDLTNITKGQYEIMGISRVEIKSITAEDSQGISYTIPHDNANTTWEFNSDNQELKCQVYNFLYSGSNGMAQIEKLIIAIKITYNLAYSTVKLSDKIQRLGCITSEHDNQLIEFRFTDGGNYYHRPAMQLKHENDATCLIIPDYNFAIENEFSHGLKLEVGQNQMTMSYGEKTFFTFTSSGVSVNTSIFLPGNSTHSLAYRLQTIEEKLGITY